MTTPDAKPTEAPETRRLSAADLLDKALEDCGDLAEALTGGLRRQAEALGNQRPNRLRALIRDATRE